MMASIAVEEEATPRGELSAFTYAKLSSPLRLDKGFRGTLIATSTTTSPAKGSTSPASAPTHRYSACSEVLRNISVTLSSVVIDIIPPAVNKALLY